MKNDWDICTGPEYDYLGHFNTPENLARGHNTTVAYPPADVGIGEQMVMGAAHVPSPTSAAPKTPGGHGGNKAGGIIKDIFGGNTDQSYSNDVGADFGGYNYGSDVGGDFGGGDSADFGLGI